MLWSEIFVWVTAQHGILEGWLAAPQPRIEKPWAQLNECSRRWQKQLSEKALGSHPECWGCEQEHCSGLLPDWYDSVYLQESTKIPDSIAFFFSPSWTSWSAQRLQCSQAHLLQRCLPACFNTLLTSVDICVKRDLMHRENEAHDLHVQLLNGLDKIKHLHPVKFTWVMWNANTALWTPDSQVMQQGVVNMSWQVHQRSVDFPQNNKQQRYFHSAWDILSFDRIIFWEYKTHKEVSILPNLLFSIFAVLYWFPNLFILRFLAGFCSVPRTFTFPFTDISWTSYICHSSLGISRHLKPVQMVRT